ncbi:class I SAM-dependent methyltransferase [Candidatus Parcubacteria bacterium]|nr:MAG: class I SAM-dependent methyltransferase [Candidatus Parcubacteria bacterium]
MNRRFGFSVAGLDYSFLGAWQAREILRQAGVEGTIVCGDLFAPPGLAGHYDVCVSYGLVEHFEDTTAVVQALSAFLRPGGMLITVVPNFSGWMGFLQKWMNRSVFDTHIPLSLEELAEAHKSADLELLTAEHWMTLNSGVINIETLQPIFCQRVVARTVLRFLWLASLLTWLLEERLSFEIPNRLTSPYLLCVAKK